MRFVFIYQLIWRTNLKMWKVQMHRTPCLKGIVGVILPKLGFLHLLEKGGGNLQPYRKYNEGPRIRRSERGRIPRRYFQIEDEVFLCAPLEVDEPTSFKEAIDSPNHKEWMDAIKDEMDSMARNKVWELVDLLPQRKCIGNK